jgi:exodeoxyribonuclease VII large subunit
MTVPESRSFFSLSKIVARIDQLLRPAMEKTFWVKAELSSCKSKGENFYCDLAETDGAGTLLAQVRCTIWASEMRRIRQKFEEQGLTLRLDDGNVVGILCRLQFHPVYGLALRGLDMDPAFVLGELELKKRAIIDRLQKEGLDKVNGQIFLHRLPIRIGLITSEGTAAFYDFTKTLFASPYGFQVMLASASMQGELTQNSILKSLAVLEKLQLDLVVICRGGGSKIDLSWLDSEVLARAIVDYRYPVWTGIGHEIDTSVLDVVAAQHFKTPTAIAEELVGRFEAFAQYTNQARHNLKSAWTFRLGAEQKWMKDVVKGIRLGTKKLIDVHRSKLREGIEGLNGRVQKRLGAERQKSSQRRQHLLMGPRAILEQQGTQLRHRREGLLNRSTQFLRTQQQALSVSRQRFKSEVVLRRVNREREQLSGKTTRLLRGPLWSRIDAERQMNLKRRQMLRAADPERNLQRGYAIVRSAAGLSLLDAQQVQPGDRLQIKLGKGQLLGRVESVQGE